jgi:hypothetical protein
VKWSVVTSSTSHDLAPTGEVASIDDRVYHSVVAQDLGDKRKELTVFGGLNGSGELAGSSYRLIQNVDGRWTVEPLVSPTSPSARYHSAMVLTPNQGIFLFGGTVNGKEGMADFWRLSNGIWEEIHATGDLPPPGFALHLSYFPDDTLLLTGGLTVFNFYKYSIAAQTWEKIRPKSSGELPPYIGHQVFPTGDGIGLIVNGHTLAGVCNDAVIQFNSWGAQEFKFILCTGMPPSGRVWGSSVLLGDYVVVLGGERESELMVLDLRDQRWHFSRPTSLVEPAVYGAVCVVCGSELYVHGGCDDTSTVHSTMYEGVMASRPPDPKKPQELQDDMWRREVVMQTDSDEPEPWAEDPR